MSDLRVARPDTIRRCIENALTETTVTEYQQAPEVTLNNIAFVLHKALDLLNHADFAFDHEGGIIRIVPDYQPGIDQPHHAPGWVPDPERDAK